MLQLKNQLYKKLQTETLKLLGKWVSLTGDHSKRDDLEQHAQTFFIKILEKIKNISKELEKESAQLIVNQQTIIQNLILGLKNLM